MGDQLPPPTLIESEVKCRSNWFIVAKTLSLREFERAYAAFCKLNTVEMVPIDTHSLKDAGIQTTEGRLRGCIGLRRALPFERTEHQLVECGGGLLLTGHSHRIVDVKATLRDGHEKKVKGK